jgi:VanZ family protein
MPRSRSQGIVIALLVGTLALIFYGSLYPFDLARDARAESIWQAIAELSWARAGRGDRVANVLLYAPLGFCLLLWLDVRMRRVTAIATTIITGVGISFCIEVTQVFIEQRVPSWWDIALNSVGTIIGVTAGLAWHELGARMRTANQAHGRRDRSALVVVCLWLIWRLAPFMPELNLGKLKSAFAPLADPFFSSGGTLHYWGWWILIAHAVFALTSAQRGVEALLALIAVVLAGCLVVSGHVFIPSELLALMLLMPTLFLFDRLTVGIRSTTLLVIFVGLFLYDSFYLLRLSESPGSFDWWPFIAWIDAGFPIDWHWLVGRACYFAALMWVLKEAGMSLRNAAICTAFVALCVATAKMFLFGQQASITEPVLAFIVAWTMRWLDASVATHLRAHSR